MIFLVPLTLVLENDLKLELENELNKFENKVLSEKFNVNLSDDEIDYWYKIICDRVRMCSSNSREISDEDILLENILVIVMNMVKNILMKILNLREIILQ